MAEIQRETAIERPFVANAATHMHGDRDAYVDRVLARLDRVERKHGNGGWHARSLVELADELAEEAEDIAGWSVGLNYRLDQEPIDPCQREQLRIRLLGVVSRGAILWGEIVALSDRLAALEDSGQEEVRAA